MEKPVVLLLGMALLLVSLRPLQISPAVRGEILSITGTDPAVGAEIIQTVPAGVRWKIISIVMLLTTDATVINREVQFVMDSGAPPAYFAYGANFFQTASRTDFYIASASGVLGTTLALGDDFAIPLPFQMILPAGHRFQTFTLNLQPGDDFTAPQFLVEEWPE